MDIKGTFYNYGYAPIEPINQRRCIDGYRLSCLKSFRDPNQISGSVFDEPLDSWLGNSDSSECRLRRRLALPFIHRWKRNGVQVLVENKVFQTELPDDMSLEEYIQAPEGWDFGLSFAEYRLEKKRYPKVQLKSYSSIGLALKQLWSQPTSASIEFYNSYGSLFSTCHAWEDPVDVVLAESWKYCCFQNLLDVLLPVPSDSQDSVPDDSNLNIRIFAAMSDLWKGVSGFEELDLSRSYDSSVVLHGPSSVPSEVFDTYAFNGIKSPRDQWKYIAERFLEDQLEDLIYLSPRIEKLGLRIVPTCLLGAIYANDLIGLFGNPLPRPCPIPRCRNYLTDDGSIYGRSLRSDAKTCGQPGCKKYYQRHKM